MKLRAFKTKAFSSPGRLTARPKVWRVACLDVQRVRRDGLAAARTTPLRGLWQHPPDFHDGSAPDLLAVVNRYNQLFGLNLTPAQKADLVEFLKSL
jgi:cytochrome c peroxidase